MQKSEQSIVFRYQVWCSACETHKIIWDTKAPIACPDNSKHSLVASKTVITDSFDPNSDYEKNLEKCARNALQAIDILIKENPKLAGKMTGHTTFGNIRAELFGALKEQWNKNHK